MSEQVIVDDEIVTKLTETVKGCEAHAGSVKMSLTRLELGVHSWIRFGGQPARRGPGGSSCTPSR